MAAVKACFLSTSALRACLDRGEQAVAHLGEMQGRCRGDAGEMQGRCRGDAGEMQGSCRGAAGEVTCWRASAASGSCTAPAQKG